MPYKLTLVFSILAVVRAPIAWGVGDLPVQMTSNQAKELYRSVLPLLNADGMDCPGNQKPVSGVITGGASPRSGSQQKIIYFNQGATVTVSKTWMRSIMSIPAKVEIDVAIDCKL
ncbi:hypothetical protein [Pseudomonas sp. CFBP 13602]|uniref:hypothetical protein n=1 Tax=Pseudomonas sp. CFBP 13602 TaxID=2774039 RepID=UPI00177DE970|nr:hypothetical protein [Pseudomonas sp. CFBP 13602]MBD8828582.1 hypothetical protein [Pseudomonas sp. CFBP 13602]